MDKNFLEGLASLVNVKAEDVAELFVTEGEETKLKDGVDPLKVASGWVKTRLDDVYKAAQRKTATQFESWIKNQGFESESQGVDLLAEYFETIKKPGDGGESSKELEQLKAAHAKALEQLKAKDAEIEKAHREGQRREVAARFKTDLRKTLGDKWAGTEEHFQVIANMFNPDRIRYDGDTAVLLDESGEPMKDELHRPVQLADQAKKYGALIGGFHAADPGKGGPPPSGGNGNGNGAAVNIPKGISDREFNEMLDLQRDPAKRKAMIEARIAQIEEGK